MRFIRTSLALTVAAMAAMAHPMGNFSVNHYSRLHFRQSGVELTYVLDLAEIPTFQLQESGPVDAGNLAKEWVSKLTLTQGGIPVAWRIRAVMPKTTDGAGGMPVLRVVVTADARLEAGKIDYRDANFPGRAGWKEIVIDHDEDSVLRGASHSATDLSKALTIYPSDPSITPPQDLGASVDWRPASTITTAAPVASAPAPANFAAQQPSAPGSVVRGDFLSRMMQKRTLGVRLMLLCLLAAFGLGAMHAMSPGHGKTIVAAYLVGSRGTVKHAGLLGLVVTSTHTFSVFLLGVGVLFFQQYIVVEKVIPMLGGLSGLSIVAVGLSLLYRRTRLLLKGGSHHHTHTLEGEITPASLIALGVGGGLVPCPSALILMLGAIAVGRAGLGLLLLFAFSAGLSLVLMGIGAMALYARHLLPDGKQAGRHPAMRLIPVLSSVVVIVLGLTITAASAGWIKGVTL